MSVIATEDFVSSAAPEAAWPCQSDVEPDTSRARSSQRRRGFVWGLLTVCVLVALFAGVSKVVEDGLAHYNLPGISAPK